LVRSPLVSVIIPTYNRSERVIAAVRSATTQTHQCVEVLVVDDGSTDGTAQRIASAFGGDPRVRYLRQPNSGVSAARNLGLAEARGDFIAFLDSDDTWRPWKLQFQLECLAHLPETVGMIWTDMDAVDGDGQVRVPRYLRRMYSAYQTYPTGYSLFPTHRFVAPPAAAGLEAPARVFLGFGDIYRAMLTGNLVHTSTVLLRRDRQRAVGGFDVALERSGEDYDYHLRTCRAGSVAFVDVSSIYYTVGLEDQLTARGYAVDLARNFLATIDKAVRADGDAFPLTRSELNQIRSEACSWYGYELLQAGDASAGRRFLARSLRLRWTNTDAAVLLPYACLPPAASRLGRRMARGVRALLAGLGLLQS